MQYPNDTQRLSIVGRTGSGKTYAAGWHLSRANFDVMPWIVYDFKRDKLLAEIAALDGAENIELDEVPTKPGIYFVHPMPDDHELVQAQMWQIWRNENTGLYIDEGYMVCGPPVINRPFRTLLTQGRSKHVPMIILSQRPVWLDRFVFSESDFYQVFALNHRGDRAKMMEYIPADLSHALPKYNSYYHDVSAAETVIMKPVPDFDVILDAFESRLSVMKKKKVRVLI